MNKNYLVLLVIVFVTVLFGETINVPEDHTTIQGAIDDAFGNYEGEVTILVADGDYVGNLILILMIQ